MRQAIRSVRTCCRRVAKGFFEAGSIVGMDQPCLSGPAVIAPQATLNAQRHRRADGCPFIEHLGQIGAVDTQLGSRLAHLQIQSGQDVVPQGEAGVG
jgi:hypothetical protein